jgi:predicted acetyltransferase
MEYRSIDPGELEAFVHAVARAFGAPVADEDDLVVDVATLDPDRCFAAVDGGEIVGCTGVYALRTQVPGGAVVPTAGVTTVGVHPTHRRRGIMTELMTRALDQARERGEPLTTLFAAEAAIYGRLGYGVASWVWDVDVDATRAAFHDHEPHGRFRFVPHDRAAAPFTEVYTAATRGRPGAEIQTAEDMRWVVYERSSERPKRFYLLHEDDDGVLDAAAIYRTKERWPDDLPDVELRADKVWATTPQAAADVWRFLLDVDLVSHVKAWNRPPDDPLRWLLREPRAVRAKVRDGLLARMLDVAGALGARSYAADGRLAVEVHDAFVPDNDGTWELAVADGTAIVTRTSSAPDLSCDAKALGSLYLGGTTWDELARAGAVRERRDGALARADAMFASQPAPWAPLHF